MNYLTVLKFLFLIAENLYQLCFFFVGVCHDIRERDVFFRSLKFGLLGYQTKDTMYFSISWLLKCLFYFFFGFSTFSLAK